MKDYPGKLVKNDKHYYLDRYIDIMCTKGYGKTNEFIAYGEDLWKRVKDLPYGYCHGDMYQGNILKASDGHLYILDFDTSCEGFPMYDLALICYITDYFDLEDDGYVKSKKVYECTRISRNSGNGRMAFPSTAFTLSHTGRCGSARWRNSGIFC